MTSIIKCTRSREYAKISNKLLQNSLLSLKARGLMAYILSLPDTWEICVEHLHTSASDHDGRTAVTGAMQELREYGYLHLERLTNREGKMAGSRWLAYDDPAENPNANQNWIADNQVFRLSENPSDGKATTIKEISEKKDIQKDKGNITPIVPLLPVVAGITPEQIYAEYPLKVGRGAAIKAIAKALAEARKTDGGAAALLRATMDYAEATAKWPEADRKFIPHPSTWYNQQRYKDDPATWVREQSTKGRAGWL